MSFYKNGKPKSDKDKAHHRAIFNELIKMLYGYSSLMAVSNFAFISLFVFLLWNVSDPFMLTLWFFVMVSIALIRSAFGIFYQRYNKGVEDVSFWRNCFVVLTGCIGFGWGVGSILFYPENSLEYQFAIAAIIYGIGTAGLIFFSIVPYAMYAFSVPAMLPLIIFLWFQDERTATVLSVCMFIGLLVYMYASTKSYANNYDNISLRLKEAEKSRLILNTQKELEKSNQAKSDFLSRMSHELRTPLNAILGFGQILELDAKDFNETQHENITEILNAGQYLLNLINEVLDLSRIESGKLDVKISCVDLASIITEALCLTNGEAQKRQLTIIDQVSDTPYQVVADSIRLKQVFVNLLSNAVKYNKEQGTIRLQCELIDQNVLRVSVIDSGEGLTAEEIEKLFIPFDRLKATHNIEGTGIGLVITRHLMLLMEGELGISSIVGEGSCFWVDLKLCETGKVGT